MNLTDVYNRLDDLASISSRSMKEACLSQDLQDETFLKVCTYAYDPFRTYGVKPKLDTPGTGPVCDRDIDIWQVLDRLAERKLTGRAALETLDNAYGFLSPQAGIVLSRILRKDLRAGFTANSINKARPETIYVFKTMLAHPYEAKRIKSWPVAVEPKLDGVRVLARADFKHQKVDFFSRNGKEFPAIQHLDEDVLRLMHPSLGSDVVFFDGEAVVGAEEFNKGSGAMRRKSEVADNAQFHMFDMITEEEFLNGSARPYKERRAALENALILQTTITPRPRRLFFTKLHLAHSDAEVGAFYEGYRGMTMSEYLGGAKSGKPMEGIIVKPLNGKWVPKRAHDWMKVKAEETLDLRVVDVKEGKGKYAGMLGALIVDLEGVRVDVGGGFTDQQRKELWDHPPIGRLIEIEYHEMTPDGSLRHPRFVRFRDDKDAGVELAA